MRFTDIFVRRPVLACVVSLMILVVGGRAFQSLAILQYPRTQNAVITISTTYSGTDPQTVAGFITTPLENAIAQANGIDYMTSTSQTGTSTITANLVLNYDSNKAMTEVNAKINSVLNQLPTGTQQPVVTVKVGQSLDAMIIGFKSSTMQPNQITDYLTRAVQPELQSIQGVQTAELIGAKTYAMRAWLLPEKLAAYGLTASDVTAALTNNDYIAGLGNTKGQMVQVTLTATTSLHSAAEFRDLVVKQSGTATIRLRDVANVTLGAQDYDSTAIFNSKTGVYLGIQTVPSANLLDVINRVKTALPGLQARLPGGLEMATLYDSTDFVNSSIAEVARTLGEALLIVTVVVFLFLGSPRSVLIPLVAIPLSLVGTFAIMLVLGFSINLLTLLALVLAIGLVVDDAIIVVESVNRHLMEGLSPKDAALQAGRDLGGPIIAMTVVLIAVYVPIGFQSGLTGALFTEFAFTLVGAVVVSAVVALTLSPMMCSFLLTAHDPKGRSLSDRIVRVLDRVLEGLQARYERMLRSSLQTLPLTLVFAGTVIGSIYFLYTSSDSELAPQEDQGVVILQPTSAPSATLQQKELYGTQVAKILSALPEAENVFQIESQTQSIGGVTLKPWDVRTRDSTTLQRLVQTQLATIAGQQVVAFQPAALPGSQGLPIQFALRSTGDTAALDQASRDLLAKARKSGLFMFIDTDLKVTQPQKTIVLDRDKIAALNLNVSSVGNALSGMLGGGYVNYFGLDSRSYQVIPQVAQAARLTPDQVMDYQVATVGGVPVPLSAVSTVQSNVIAGTVSHFQQINSATLSGVTAPGVTQATALAYLQGEAAALPKGFSVDTGGQLRQFVQESSGFLVTFALALIIIYLSLAALFESFRDPIVILASIPMSIAGALVFISLGLGGVTLNIYTDVGLVTLMGLISKHGILIVEVANEARVSGLSKLDAVVHAAGLRLRPILMTTAAMVLGVVPLILAEGAGAASRFAMGLVIATGLSIGTLFTLFVLPAVYVVVASKTVFGAKPAGDGH